MDVLEPADDDGRESTSEGVEMLAYDDDGSDIVDVCDVLAEKGCFGTVGCDAGCLWRARDEEASKGRLITRLGEFQLVMMGIEVDEVGAW